MKKTDEQIEEIAIKELDKRYGKGAENKTMNKIWLTGFMVGFAMGQEDAMSLSAENNEMTDQSTDN